MTTNTKRVYEDGLHYVRPASAVEAKKSPDLLWTVQSVRGASRSLKRQCPDEATAISTAKTYTKMAVARNAADAALVDAFKAAATIQAEAAAAKQAKREAEIACPPFATTHFICRDANPTAQVWQCVSRPGERGPVGRKSKDGRAPKQATFNHDKGEFAVMRWDEPVRDPDGQVRVFATFIEASHFALDLHFSQAEDERLAWEEGETHIWHTTRLSVVFNPKSENTREPFMIWVPTFGKFIKAPARKATYVTKPKNADGSSYHPPNKDAKAAMELNMKLARLGQDQTILTDEDHTFRTPWQAAEHAIWLERSLYDCTLPYTYGP